MSEKLLPSELILNPDGSVYHIKLKPEDLGDYIITVGDPERVPRVSRYFNEIEVKKGKREFITHVGRLGDKRITVISTGIGPDNIDIVLNELDALANIDLDQRTIKEQLTSLKIIRLGTSGCLQAHIPVDSLLFTSYSVGLDNLLHFYDLKANREEQQINEDLSRFFEEKKINFPTPPHFAQGSNNLLQQLQGDHYAGITLTAPGFYAPQGRKLRASTKLSPVILDQLAGFKSLGFQFTNFEMETSAIYGLSRLLGHEALSCSAILANRANKTFSQKPDQIVDDMIKEVLEKISVL